MSSAHKNNSQVDFPNVLNIPTYKFINTTPRETLNSNVVKSYLPKTSSSKML